LRALDVPNHVDGRDKPGHDALKTRAANLSYIPDSVTNSEREKRQREARRDDPRAAPGFTEQL